MNLSPRRILECLPVCGWILAGLLCAGCSHLYYADPNPPQPFTFPGQGQTAAQPAPIPTPASAVSNPGVGAQPTAPSNPKPAGTDLLTVGDSITVSFSDIPPPGLLPSMQRIRDDGKITLPFNVSVVAAGKTVGALQDDIRAAYVPKYFVQMTASVTSEERVFFVEGEVKTPSRLPYKGEMTVLRAITSAGGFTDFANRKTIELHRTSGEKIIINWYKAIKDSKLDKKVYPNDQVIVRRKLV